MDGALRSKASSFTEKAVGVPLAQWKFLASKYATSDKSGAHGPMSLS